MMLPASSGPAPSSDRTNVYDVDDTEGDGVLMIPAEGYAVVTDLRREGVAASEVQVHVYVNKAMAFTAGRVLDVCNIAPGYSFSTVRGDGTQFKQSDFCWQHTEGGEQLLVVEVKAPCEFARPLSLGLGLKVLPGVLNPEDFDLFVKTGKVSYNNGYMALFSGSHCGSKIPTAEDLEKEYLENVASRSEVANGEIREPANDEDTGKPEVFTPTFSKRE